MTYDRIKRELPHAAEGEILDRAAWALNLPRERIGEILREPVPIKRYVIKCRHKNFDSGGN